MRPFKKLLSNDRFLTDYHHWPVYFNGLALYHTCRFVVQQKKYGFRQYYTDNVALSDTGGIFSQLVQISSSEAPLQLTKLSPSRIGIVSFANTAAMDTPLVTSVDALKSAVDSLSAGGSTNHADAFTKAVELFDPASGNAKVIVMFTDGNTTTGEPPAPLAASARAQGITIYCIGLIGTDGLDINALNSWATDPDASHVAVTPDAADLEKLFAELAANISKPGATNIAIHEMVNPDFIITSILSPTKGVATMLDAHSLKWDIPTLGVNSSESTSLDFFIRHVSQIPGIKLVNQSITYTDTEGNNVSFPDPVVKVECDTAESSSLSA